MFQEAFEKLELANVATVLDQVGPQLDGLTFDPLETTIMALDLPFYPGFKLLDIGDYTSMPVIRRFVVYSPKKSVVLDFTNGPIYALNQEVPVKLMDENIESYVRFFFSYVRGRHGRFLIVENVDDIRWKDDPPPTARKAIGKMLIPITIKEIADDGTFYLQACMTFKDSLFKSDIYVQKSGLVTLKNEELLIEDMPVLDDLFGL